MTPTARSIFHSPSPGAEAERRFFAAIRTPDGVLKTTDRQRMGDLNAELATWCRDRGLSSVDILDVAASSGVSSADLRADLQSHAVQADITATDILMDGALMRVGPGCYALVDDKGRVLQHDLFGLAIRPYYSGNPPHDLVSFAANQIHRVLAALRAPVMVRQIKLVSQAGEGIRFLQDDLFADSPELNGRFDVVRAANVLNLVYFDRDRICAAVRNLTRRLKGPGALLVVNRTDEAGVNNGSLFELGAAGSYRVAARIGAGSEVEDVVLSL